MNKHFFLLAAIAFTSITFTACEKEDPDIDNEEELITTLNYTLTPSNGGTAITLTFVDLDGDGGDAPTITGGVLAENQTYSGALKLLNESESPAESISEEIEEEDEDHQFFFASNISDLTVTYSDQDSLGNPIGLSSSLTTGNAAAGSLTITLRHEPNKSGSGVSGGDITNAGGETDIEVTFPIDVQ